MATFTEQADRMVNLALAAGETDPNLPIYTQGDMDRVSAIAGRVKSKADQEYRDAIRTIAALVELAGGQVEIPDVLLVDGPAEVKVWTNPLTFSRVISTHRPLNAKSPRP